VNFNGQKLFALRNKVAKLSGTVSNSVSRGVRTKKWRILHTEELHNLYSSRITRLIKSSMLKCVGHAAYMGKTKTSF
jgi:hypothetical protein